jgi:hypothetical protein
VWWVLLACPKRDPDPAVQARQLLARADQAWEQRGTIGLEEATEPLLGAYAVGPSLPGVAWRLARWHTAEGLAATDDEVAKGLFAEGRAAAVACLEASPGFDSRRAGSGWAAALADIEDPRRPCVAWAALAWSRWMALHGAEAAAVDLEAVDALVATGRDGAGPKVEPLLDQAEGILLAIRPAWAGRDPERAEALLREAVEQDPGSVVALVDLYRWVVGPFGSAEERAQLRARIEGTPPRTPEDEGALARFDQVVEAR